MKIKQIAVGLLTYIPFFKSYAWKSTGGSNDARYCYSVWMRHIVSAYNNSLCTSYPKTVAELGPGDSLGIGLAALVTGVDRYYAFDVVDYTSIENNLSVFEEIVQLFKSRAPIPDDKEFPRVKPYLDSYEFPNHVFSGTMIQDMTSDKRIEQIRQCILGNSNSDLIIYKAPWYAKEVTVQVDMIYSQAVLEHIDELDVTYTAMFDWLKDDGFMSHQIDFKSHGLAKEWNGHWAYSAFIWKILRGQRLYLINREPLSTHKQLLKKYKFNIKNIDKITSKSAYRIKDLSKTFHTITEEDLVTSGAFIQATKGV